MRDITRESVNAFLWGFTFRKSNMKVIITSEESKLYYHNNLIAIKDRITNKVRITNAGWESNTTKERLNGVINLSQSKMERIYQKDFIWYLDGKSWDGKLTQIN